MRLHNRQVKAAFWTDSELIKNLNRDGRVFYLGLIQLADDSGCLEDDAFAFKIHLFPGDMDITPDMLVQFRDKLVEMKKLIPYESEGKACLFLKNFHKHQSLDNPSKPDVPLPTWIKWVPYKSNARAGKYEVGLVSEINNNSDLQAPYTVLTDGLQNPSNQNQNLNLNQNQNNNVEDNAHAREDESEPDKSKTAVKHYEQNIGLISPSTFEQMNSFLDDGIQEDLVIKAIDVACSQNVRKWSYIKAILQNCLGESVYSKAQFEAKETEFQNQKKVKNNGGHSPPRKKVSAFDRLMQDMRGVGDGS